MGKSFKSQKDFLQKVLSDQPSKEVVQSEAENSLYQGLSKHLIEQSLQSFQSDSHQFTSTSQTLTRQNIQNLVEEHLIREYQNPMIVDAVTDIFCKILDENK